MDMVKYKYFKPVRNEMHAIDDFQSSCAPYPTPNIQHQILNIWLLESLKWWKIVPEFKWLSTIDRGME